MPGDFYLFISFSSSYQWILSSVIDLGAKPFVLWSNKTEYWFIGGRQLYFASSFSCSSVSFHCQLPRGEKFGKPKPSPSPQYTAHPKWLWDSGSLWKKTMQGCIDLYGSMVFLAHVLVRTRGFIIVYKYVCWFSDIHSGMNGLLKVAKYAGQQHQ